MTPVAPVGIDPDAGRWASGDDDWGLGRYQSSGESSSYDRAMKGSSTAGGLALSPQPGSGNALGAVALSTAAPISSASLAASALSSASDVRDHRWAALTPRATRPLGAAKDSASFTQASIIPGSSYHRFSTFSFGGLLPMIGLTGADLTAAPPPPPNVTLAIMLPPGRSCIRPPSHRLARIPSLGTGFEPPRIGLPSRPEAPLTIPRYFSTGLICC